MNLKQLREFILREDIADLPGGTEVIIEFGSAGQKSLLFAQLCIYTNGGLDYSATEMLASLADSDGLDPEGWDTLDQPVIKLVG